MIRKPINLKKQELRKTFEVYVYHRHVQKGTIRIAVWVDGRRLSIKKKLKEKRLV